VIVSRVRTVWSRVDRYTLAVVFVVGALGIVMLLGRILPFTFFLSAVMLAAWFRGAAVGIFALVLSLVALSFLLGSPPYVLGFSAEYLTRFVTFTFSAMLVVWMSAARRKAEVALRTARDELDERVRERTASLEQAYVRLQAEIEERKRGEQRLATEKRRAHERVLQARFAAQLEERTRLAREIHDTLLQGFTGVSLQLLAAMGRPHGSPEYESALRDVLSLAQKTLADARQAVWDMRPPALDDGDFTLTLRAILEQRLSEHALALDYIVRGMPHILPPDVETVVFRVAQEAIVNVVKHAAAQTVRVKLVYGHRSVRLTVADDGHGFHIDPDLRTYAGHWGLLGMRERASQLHGQLAVQSAPGRGTKVVLQVPSRNADGGMREPAITE
jgi:signal transduction histidine kinase